MSKTSKKTKTKHITKPWTEAHKKKYNSLFNYLTVKLGLPYEKDSYITLNKREVFKYILENGAWKDGTKEVDSCLI